VKWDIGFWTYDMYGNGEFLGLSPNGIGIGPDGSIYVTNTHIDNPDGHCVIKLDSSGNFLAKWGTQGSGYGEFDNPTGIAVASNGFIIVADTNNHRIQKLDSDGNIITSEWGVGGGDRDGEFKYPEGIAIGYDGSVFVADTWNHRIQKFDSSGNFIGQWGSYGIGDGQFNWSYSIAIGADGSLYVVDRGNHRIQRMIGEDTTQTLFQATLSINQAASSSQDYSTNIGALGVTAKLYLQTTLTNSLGQTLGQSSYPFYLFTGGTALFFNTDKKVYNPGETITITGRVENRAGTNATNLVLTLNSKYVGQGSQLLFTETFDLAAGSSHPFTISSTAGNAGMVILTGVVTKDTSTLVEIKDKFDVASP
jgi:hypothetical protein